MVWANLPRTMGECAPAWGKLAISRAFRKVTYALNFIKLKDLAQFTYIWPYVNFHINNILGSSMSNFFNYVKFFKKWANMPRSPLRGSRTDYATKCKILVAVHDILKELADCDVISPTAMCTS